MSEFQAIFRKVNGGKVLREYAQAHVLLYALAVTAIEGISKKSLELVRESVSNKIVKRLRKKYTPFINEFKKGDVERAKLVRRHSKKVWVCWLQGMEYAPEIVKKCYQSLLDNLVDREIVLLTEQNYKEWVTFPDYIQKKFDDGVIGRTHMSDLLRLELLEHYGGTWIDATVLCTGKNIPGFILDSDLFLYQIMKPGLDGHAQRTSNWFITACTNQPILLLVKSLLYEYWETHDTAIDYFLFHDFMELAIEAYPDEWRKVVPVSSSIPHILLLRFGEEYDERIWEAAKQMTPFHKLSWKLTNEKLEEMERPNTYYDVIIKSHKG